MQHPAPVSSSSGAAAPPAPVQPSPAQSPLFVTLLPPEPLNRLLSPSRAAELTRNFQINIGTIGHVAHGKSSTVRAISGVQTVRFKNELERNITIKLGYANAKVRTHRGRPEGKSQIGGESQSRSSHLGMNVEEQCCCASSSPPSWTTLLKFDVSRHPMSHPLTSLFRSTSARTPHALPPPATAPTLRPRRSTPSASAQAVTRAWT